MTKDIARQIPTTMRAFAIDHFGEPGSSRELPTPTIGVDEMLVHVRAAGVPMPRPSNSRPCSG
jgi:hypothetical protein